MDSMGHGGFSPLKYAIKGSYSVTDGSTQMVIGKTKELEDVREGSLRRPGIAAAVGTVFQVQILQGGNPAQGTRGRTEAMG